MANEKEEEELIVVWSGGPLLPERDQHPDPTWDTPTRKNRGFYRLPLSFERESKLKEDENG